MRVQCNAKRINIPSASLTAEVFDQLAPRRCNVAVMNCGENNVEKPTAAILYIPSGASLAFMMYGWR